MGISSRSRKRRSEPAIFAVLLLAIFLAAPLTSAAPSVTESGIPATANAGDPIPVHINLTSAVSIYEVRITYTNPSTGVGGFLILMNQTSGDAYNGTWSFSIPAQPWKGELECHITAKDDDGYSMRYPESGYFTIEILGEDEPREFPWNLVVVIIFLGAVMVLTELVFKPGLYRKTGREKARELEEEDRLREQEEDKKDY